MKRPCMKAAVILGAAAFLFTSGFARAEDHAAGTAGYLKSATYYSDDWVINFWNSESGNMDQELARIAQDGFNNIILVVPWREFQPGMTPCTYNQYAWVNTAIIIPAVTLTAPIIAFMIISIADKYNGHCI